ncbi:MAG: molybdate ABC transporter permease subunit [candidate division KSB1 bacterium]|nr:molybdate ABC transporter permease subunit [candidate division KSB1 bacterium]MDZ7275646.1 molybdate ABC transporter permease subunit [candidate division KSB1 bacterium]MDZ7284663.1 molybdate ABC transporter permease subunit [candidate division KSB1 bacterium]MDZ7297918.1 molybdate ABC transporter permease subunit [candidate division KSB1 bacterium]MDZ7307117.1 molybdate ABC transporter permease subunit [candidate division KSB1 bacterium]
MRLLSGLPPELWEVLWLSVRLASVVTLLLLLVSVPLAWGLSRRRWRGMIVLETMVSLPIVLPPTVIGFYLLILFSPQQPLGKFWLQLTGRTLTFTFEGLVIGSIIYSLPYAVQPILNAFKSVPPELLDAARTLGASGWQAFRHVTLPLSRRGLGVAAVLGFAHTLGEFGVVVMLGGSIPGKTKVASIALYDEVQKLNYDTAHQYALILLVTSFVMLLTMTVMQRKMDEDG